MQAIVLAIDPATKGAYGTTEGALSDSCTSIKLRNMS